MPSASMLLAALLVAARSLSAQSVPAVASDTALERALRGIAETSGGVLGAAALHIETGKRVSIRGDERFPMVSVYKVPIAIAVVTRAEWGELKLTDSVPLLPSDLHPGRSPLAQRYPAAGVKLTIAQLLEAMLVESDNTAGDLLMRVAGGPEMVTGRLREIGVRDILVSRPEARIALDYYGVTNPPPDSAWTLTLLERLLRDAPAAQRTQGAAWFLDDERDTATPNAMTDLLAALFAGRVVSPESATWLLELMASTPTGPKRLKGKLPRATVVAHKTGTSGSTDGVTGAVNDVGIITLPNGAGHVAISVLVKGTSSETAAEAAIAGIGERVYNAWKK
jgi:beta-lactamase class A